MPHRLYKHICSSSGKEITCGADVCRDCGQAAQFASWGRSGIESMHQYQRRTGLKPIGPHGDYARTLLAGILTNCPVCGGSGIRELGDEDWCDCGACDGRGTVPAPSDPRVQLVLRLVATRYPGAVACER